MCNDVDCLHHHAMIVDNHTTLSRVLTQMTGVDGLQPLETSTTASIVASRIREAIADGSFPPGTRLGEAQLSRALGVSRGPVREALQRLIQEGLLRDERNRGVFVVDLGPKDIEEIYEARAAIERAAVRRLVASPGLEEDVVRLATIVEQMDRAAQAGDWRAIAQGDMGFHEALVASTQNDRLRRLYATLLTETRMCLMRLESAYANPGELVDEHRAIVEALRARDADRALAAIDDHLLLGLGALKSDSPSSGERVNRDQATSSTGRRT